MINNRKTINLLLQRELIRRGLISPYVRSKDQIVSLPRTYVCFAVSDNGQSMESYEDDDDTHFCIKCHLTIHGLENYVRHRQSGCRPPDDKNVAVRVSPTTPASPTTVFYPEILNADAFFSSLELRSSSKSNTRKTTGLLEESRKFKKEEKQRKKSPKSSTQVENEDSATVKEKLHNMLPGVAELDDPTDHLCMPSLVGFPEIVSSAAGKSTVVTSGRGGKLSQSMGHVAANMDGGAFVVKHEPENSLERILMTSHVESKQTERKRQDDAQRMEHHVHQTWLEDTILAELVANNENKDLGRYEFEYQQDDDSDDDMLEEDLGEDDEGGSYTESDDGEDRERPPRGHIGGKWKPELDDLPQNMSQLQDDDVEPEDEHQEHPPPTYTGGKWRPSDASQVRNRRNCFVGGFSCVNVAFWLFTRPFRLDPSLVVCTYFAFCEICTSSAN